jgi:hypothetical protein
MGEIQKERELNKGINKHEENSQLENSLITKTNFLQYDRGMYYNEFM